MSADIIQADYEGLDQVAGRLGQRAEATSQLQSRVARCMQALEQGGWEGQGAAAFFAEMRGEVQPAMQRLMEVLDDARAVTLEAKDILRAAEEEAASVFKGAAANSSGDGAASEDSGGLWDSIGEWVHGALDVVGFIPGFGEIADGANAVIYLAEGRYVEATISAAAMIPIFGDVGKVGKWGVKAGKEILEEAAETGAKRVAREAAEEGAERVAREAAEEGAERAAREAAEEGAERGAREVGDVTKLREGAKITRPPIPGVGAPPSKLVDVSANFKSRTYRKGNYIYEETSGPLGHPDFVQKHRDVNAQRSVSRGTGDDAGHRIGDRFGAPGDRTNLGAQNRPANQFGTWKKDLEDMWERKVRGGTYIEARVTDITRSGETRPFMRRAEWTEVSPDGVVSHHSQDFMNPHTPLSRQQRGVPPTVTEDQTGNVFPIR